MSRELVRIEYEHLWPGMCDHPVEFAEFLANWNLECDISRRVPFYLGSRGTLKTTTVYREQLPDYYQVKLDAYEATLAVPFVGGYWKQSA